MSIVCAAGVIAAAVALAKKWAADDAHGYDQANRWGPDYDCSSFLIAVWEAVGVPVREAGATYTGNIIPAFLACGFRDVTAEVNLLSGPILRAGDVLLNVRQHTAMYVGDGLIVHAAGNEYGGATGGQPGDQTGREICVQGYYYSPSCPWEYVLRFEGTVEQPDDPVSIPNTSEIYTVQPGDSLWAIAQRFGTTAAELARINGIADPNLIYPGQVLRLPGAAAPDPDPDPAPDEVKVALPVLREGSAGKAVETVQMLLLADGYDLGTCGIDGDFGPDTAAALEAFQVNHTIPVSRETDARTWRVLIR